MFQTLFFNVKHRVYSSVCGQYVYLIILRTTFLSLPVELEESAQINGANHLTVLLKIVIPLSMPVISVIMLYTAVDYCSYKIVH
ncbi:ABC transporter permease subunit, partial [Acinetobacter baumannii]|uniref:ABC transporter permease subunit n=1 Tax=Acinetobacter baumannii TaxID=470 RepID=UPI002FE22F2C